MKCHIRYTRDVEAHEKKNRQHKTSTHHEKRTKRVRSRVTTKKHRRHDEQHGQEQHVNVKRNRSQNSVRIQRGSKWRIILPIATILAVGSLGAYLTFRGHGAPSTPTFKLFAPAWRGLGGDANLNNVKHFKEIFGRVRSSVPAAKVGDGTRFYKYSLGPYVAIARVQCDLIPPDQPYLKAHPGSCGTATPTLNTGMARGISSDKVVWTNDFGHNNFLLTPDDPQTLNYVKNDASTLPGGFDGLLSDSMGFAAIAAGSNYLNEKPRKPGTTRQYYNDEWIAAQISMLQAKKSGLPAGKVLMINGLGNGDAYFAGADNASPRAFASMPAVAGVMAERIFRDPSSPADGPGAWDSVEKWEKDVRMIADVQAKGKLGYWWTKCWTGDDNCQALPNANEVITKWRRFSVASFLLGAGSNSYYNYDTKKNDISPASYIGTYESEANAAEWFAGDYTKAEEVGVGLGTYSTDGGVYKRTFSNGLVVVNPDGSPHTINLGGARYAGFDGTSLTGSYTVPAHTGNVLALISGSPGDTNPPVVTRSAPAAGATLSGVVAVTGNATDNVGVTKTDLLVDGAVKGSDTSPPAVSISLDTKTLSNGTHIIALKAYDARGNASQSAPITVTVSNGGGSGDPVIATFTANPNPVIVGGKTWLSWTTNNTTSCSVNPDGVQNTRLFTWQTPALSTAGTKDYTLNCVNSAGKHATKPLTITVKNSTTPPAKPTLTATATTIQKGKSTTLNWRSSAATSCTLNPGGIVSTGASGSRVISPTSTTTYKVTCKNSAGSSASDGLTITVTTTPPPPGDPAILSFTASSDHIESGQRSTLAWSTSNVRPGGCNLRPSPLSSTDPNGSWDTPPLSTSVTYTLTCVNSLGKATSRSTSVTVADIPPPPPPDPENPDEYSGGWEDETLTDSESGDQVDNGAVDDDVSGLAVLDPSNVADKDKIEQIDHVEYYVKDKLVQSIDAAPFALNTKLLKNGTYTITEKTYYKDGSTSEVVRTVTINNKNGAGTTTKGKSSGLKTALAIGLGILLLAFATFGLMAWRQRRQATATTDAYPSPDYDSMYAGNAPVPMASGTNFYDTPPSEQPIVPAQTAQPVDSPDGPASLPPENSPELAQMPPAPMFAPTQPAQPTQTMQPVQAEPAEPNLSYEEAAQAMYKQYGDPDIVPMAPVRMAPPAQSNYPAYVPPLDTYQETAAAPAAAAQETVPSANPDATVEAGSSTHTRHGRQQYSQTTQQSQQGWIKIPHENPAPDPNSSVPESENHDRLL